MVSRHRSRRSHREAHKLAGILLLTITWWLTEPVPLAVTGLAAVALTVFLGAVPVESDGRFEPARTALAPFADPSAFFLLGGLFIGRAMERHGLDRRIALSLLCTRWAGRSPHTVLAAIGASVSLISMWISNTAATAMMYPVTLGIIAVLAAGQGTDDEDAGQRVRLVCRHLAKLFPEQVRDGRYGLRAGGRTHRRSGSTRRHGVLR